MRKGEFDLTGKAIDCSGLINRNSNNFNLTGREIFRALKEYFKVGVDYSFEDISEFPYIALTPKNKVAVGSRLSLGCKVIQPSDVLGQAAIDAAMDGATIVFEGDELPVGLVKKYMEDGSFEKIMAMYPEASDSDKCIIAYKNFDVPRPPSIESKVLAEKVGSKYDQGKPRYDLVPVHAEAEFVDVLTFGAEKYGAENWRKVDQAKERYTAAAMRHLAAYRMGDTHDIESGKHHLAHAMCCLAFITEMDLEAE